MAGPDRERDIEATHPHWVGALRLSSHAAEGFVVHVGHGSRGTFRLNGDRLSVLWDDFAPEEFVEQHGRYVHVDCLRAIPALESMHAATVGNRPFVATRVAVRVPGYDHDVNLRLGTSDVPVFEQVFVHREYENANLPDSAGFIVDLGANIGLATVFFAQRFPQAQLLAVEPDDRNFDILAANTAGIGERLQRRLVAAWISDGTIALHTESASGVPLGAWGVQVSETADAAGRVTQSRTIASLLDDAGFDFVDILKIDVEGAELEIFGGDVGAWLTRTRLIVVETHDRFRPGSEAAVRAAVRADFEELPGSGENLFFRRRG